MQDSWFTRVSKCKPQFSYICFITTCSYCYRNVLKAFFALSAFVLFVICNKIISSLKLCVLLREKEKEERKMAQTMGRNMAAPLLFLNLIMYFILIGFTSWCLNRYINGTTYHPSMGGNGATPFFLTFAMLTAVLGVASKLAGLYHIRAWRSDSLAGAGSASLITWAVTVLAFGLACKQISIGGHRGWRLRVVEAFIIILTFTQLLYLLLLHAGIFSRRYGPGYWDTDYGMGGGTAAPGEPPKGTAGTRVV